MRVTNSDLRNHTVLSAEPGSTLPRSHSLRSKGGLLTVSCGASTGGSGVAGEGNHSTELEGQEVT
jgi:hypothetical protein